MSAHYRNKLIHDLTKDGYMSVSGIWNFMDSVPYEKNPDNALRIMFNNPKEIESALKKVVSRINASGGDVRMYLDPDDGLIIDNFTEDTAKNIMFIQKIGGNHVS